MGQSATFLPMAEPENHDLLDELLVELFTRIGDDSNFVRAVFSGRRRNFMPEAERVDIKPVLIKGEYFLQVIYSSGSSTTTKNFQDKKGTISELFQSGYANFLVETRDERYEARIGKKGQVFSKISRVNLTPDFEHDKKKRRVIDESDPFLIAVGISDRTGKIKPSMSDKFHQVDEFLKILEITAKDLLDKNSAIRVIDLGCGHAYLTFAALRYFQLIGKEVEFFGVDIREASRIRNENLSKELGVVDKVTFIASEISELPDREVDIAIALHACDTATDDALAWAVRNGAKVILAAPCCHHDLHKQVKEVPDFLNPIFDHGILQVRQLDLLTDALRAQLLRAMGYKTDVIEFVSGDHTSRNLMIRAIATSQKSNERLGEYRHTCSTWGITPALYERLKLGTEQTRD